jgi:hypothetical protein
MNVRLRKEFRAFLLPWSATGMAAVLMGFGQFFTDSYQGELHGWRGDLLGLLCGIAPVIFIGGVLFMAGSAFGVEFRERTMTLWLSQGVSRAQLWKEKMLALALAVSASGLLGATVILLSHSLVRHLPEAASHSAGTTWMTDFFWAALSTGLFFLTTVCGVCFWTLLGRSTLGGIVFSLGAQFGIFVSVVLVMEKLFSEQDKLKVRAVVTIALIYAAVLLWLGRQKFGKFESRDAVPGEGGLRIESLSPLHHFGKWVQCAASSRWLNLVRKEIGLSRALYVIAMVYTLCWLLCLGSLWLMPGRETEIQAVMGALVGIYIALMLISTGCLALVEERNLGTHAWHLTLPISTPRQWLVKLGVALVHAELLVVLLPYALALLMPSRMGPDLPHIRDAEEVFAFLGLCALICAGGLVLSFWAASLSNNSTQAALIAVSGLVSMFACAGAATWCAQHLQGSWDRFAGWLIFLKLLATVANSWEPAAYLLMLSPLVATMLIQSLLQFRRAETRPLVLLKYAPIVCLVAFLTEFCVVNGMWAAMQSR